MKVVLQRSKAASVTVQGEVTGAIDSGYVLLVGITHEDTTEDVAYLAKKSLIYACGKIVKEK